MTRRSRLATLALALATAASIATSPIRYPALFEGYQWADGPSFLLTDEAPHMGFLVEVTTTLPAEAATEDFTSEIAVHPAVSEGPDFTPISLELVDCDEGLVLAASTDVSLDLTLSEPMADCEPETVCVIPVCFHADNLGTGMAPITWRVRASVASWSEVEEEDGESIPVDIDIAIEPLEAEEVPE